MSLINKMLEDLDRRNAAVDPGAPVPPGLVRAVSGAHRGREWFWRVMAALMLLAVAWVAWVAYHLQSRPVATDAAFKAAEQARRPVTAAGAMPGAQHNFPVPAAKPAEPAKPPVPAADKPDGLKLALALQSPAAEAPAKEAPAKEAPAKPAEKRPVEKARPAPAAAPPAAKVERRDRERTPKEKAEGEFRRAALLLNQGRGLEAEESFAAALQTDPSHQGARQALIALHLERGQLDRARRLLQDGLALDSSHAEFAFTLGRIQVESGDLPGALATLQGAASTEHAGVQILRGTVLQRLGRHAEATAAYRSALRLQNENSAAWIGLGISLEALQQRPQAAEAFQRALAAGPSNPELRVFAEQRIRALR